MESDDLQVLIHQLQGKPPWRTEALAGTWNNIVGEEPAGWRHFTSGRTEVRGAVTAGTTNTVFTISDPLARPQTTIRRSGIGRQGATTGAVEVTVTTAGDVQVRSPLSFPSSPDFFSIACSFDSGT